MPKSDTWFRPGTSGNPGGRPKNRGNVNMHAREYAARAIFSLVKQLTAYNSRPADQRAAARLLLRVGFGSSTNIGDQIILELGWHRVREQLKKHADFDAHERGSMARRELTGGETADELERYRRAIHR